MNLKSILLGAAAAAAAATTAQAADLPVAPEPVDYVRVCDAFGTGFFYIPGTETCLRVGGRIRADFYFNDFGDSNASGSNAWDQRTDAGTSTRARGYIRLDARTNTEYGLVRAYIDTYFTANSGIGDSSSTGTTLDKAFIQFGSFTFGRTTSFFDYFTGGAFNGPIGHVWSDKGSTWVAAYTAAFGNGISATLSVEDGTYRQIGTTGHRAPDLVANLRVDQGWGSAQIMGALHEARLAPTASKTKVGYAIGAGVTFKLPMIAAKDSISFQAQYADGAISYAGAPSITGLQDAYFFGGTTKTTKAWSVSGGLTHYWTSQWSTNIDASYAKIDLPFGFNDATQWGVSGNLVWEPVSGLIFGGELEYRNRSIKNSPDKDSIAGMFRVQRTF
ncbi:Porin omp2b precursor [Pannonibacter phragmitetus]|uniref:Porin n=1 Tax=Pannonibacter phragmitetus TaxID=121719 RepID=A0A378ZV81_9HYPH|nr:porin [Pannonibacter phragmitetus]SUB00471.1 Porin omp2b precursor [Pannonibacter phragmitetus]